MMKKIIGLLVLSQALCLNAFSAVSSSDIALVNPVAKNLLLNPGFESGTAGWVQSGGTFTTFTASAAEGGRSAQFTASAAGQYIFAAASIPPGLQGRSCLAKILYKGGDANLALEATDGTNVLATQTLAASTSYIKSELTFVCPTSGTVVLRVKSTAASAAIQLDGTYLGENYKIGSGIASTDVTTYSLTIGASTTAPTITSAAINSARWSRVGDRMIIAYDFQLTGGSAGSGNYKFPLPSGYAIDTTKQTLNSIGSGSSVGPASCYRVTTMYTGFVFAYDATDLGMNVGGFTVGSGGCATDSANQVYSFIASIPIVGWGGTASTYTADSTPASWSGYHNTGCSFQRTNGTMGDPTNAGGAGCNLIERTNRNFGTVTSAGGLTGASALAGITWTPTRAGRYRVCALATVRSATSGADMYFQLTDGTTPFGVREAREPASNNRLTVPICGIYNVATATATTLKIQTSGSADTIIDGNLNPIDWDITQLDAPSGAPVFVGSVTSNTSGTERVERAMVTTICTSTPCTIASQSGSWLSSITRSGSGDYVLNVAAGMFSAPPSCNFTALSASTDRAVQISPNSTPTATSVEALFQTRTFGALDVSFSVTCMGPR